MQAIDHNAALCAIWELTDKGTGLMIRAMQIGGKANDLSEKIHETNMAWRKLALTLGGISLNEYEAFVQRQKDTDVSDSNESSRASEL